MKRRILSIITALALCLSLCPTWALAAEADPSLCKHHPEHTEDCGYTAPTEGHDCGHEHTAECYTKGILPDADSGDPYQVGGDTENLLDCHHSHNSECGYVQADPGTPCGYECRICPIEDLIAALPEQVTEDNRADVRGQLDYILDLYRELNEDEQEEIGLSRIYALQGALDAANDPDPIAESVNYQEASWNGGVTYTTQTTDSCTPVANSAEAVTWNAGWYVVNSTVTISEPITVTGAVNLILADGCTLNAEKGIVVPSDASLTIYAQSGGSGTLNATGTTDSDYNASAGIGGSTSSFDSGAITIHGGVINATGGTTNPNNGYSGAGIGGGRPGSGNGGNSGTIIIYGGTVTANSGAGNSTGAGIGGGASSNDGNGGAGSNITIYGGNVTAESHGTSNGGSGAGIGGGGGAKNGGTGESINIYGGTVNATGGNKGAGIGGGSGGSSNTSGSGTNITISGGTVTAEGGQYAAGIGGGGGFYYSGQYGSGGLTGGTGSVIITGGIVDAKGGAGNSSGNYAGDPIGNGGNAGDTAATVSKTNAIVFENGEGTVCGDVTFDGSYTVPADYTLNIPAGASLSGSGTLSGGSAFTTENLTEDMISVPTNLYYNGEDRTADITTKLSGELTKGVTICGQTFTVSGWTLAVEKAADSDLTYTATYTNNSDNTKTVQKTITLLQSGTDLTSEGKVLTYNGETQTDTFTAGDIIKVVATPTATGAAPTNSAMFAASFTPPGAGQMAVFVGDTQVSAPVGAVDGTYTMTVSAADVLTKGQAGQDDKYTLIVKFVENTNMAGAEAQVEITITPNPLTADMVILSAESGTYSGTEQKPTVTVTGLTEGTDYEITYTGNFTSAGEHTLTVTGKGIYRDTVEKTYTIGKATPTITWGSTTQELTYTGDPAAITAPTVTLVNNEQFAGTISYSYQKQGETAYKDDLPTDTGTYTIKAHVVAAGNYTAADSGEMTLTINPSPVTLTFNDQTITYGDTPTLATADPASAKIEYSYTTGEGGEPISGWPTNAGTYTVTAKVEATGNYGEASETAQLTIDKATLTITGATVASKPYDGADTATVSGVTFTGLVNGETLALGTDYTATGQFVDANAGTGKSVTVTVTLADTAKANNYQLSDSTCTATADITKASSSITKAPTASGITYGQALSDSNLTDGAGSVAGAFSWTAPATKPSAGTAQYEVTFTPTNTNYNTATVNVSVTVSKATPILTAPTASAVEYGQRLSDSTLTGGTATNPNGNAAVAGSWSWASGNTRPTATGTFPVAFVPGDTANYNTPGNVDASVTVSAAAPKITLTVPAYQVANGVVEVKYTAANSHDATLNDLPAVTLTYKVGSGAEQPITDGRFTIPEGTAVDTVIIVTASTAAVDGKYTAATKTATVTVTDKIPVEISGVGVTGRAYNGKAIDHTGTPVIKTLDGKTVTDATVTYTWNTSDGTAPVNAGSYTLTISVGGEKYIGSTTVDFTIEKATVTITAANKSAVVGSAQPELTYTVSGLADGETLATVPTLTCTPDMNTVGSYPITASGAAVPNASNYNTEITYVAGTLSVTAKPSTGGGGYVPSGPGSSTITVPVSGDKSTVHVSASVSGTTATVSKIDTSQIENVIGDNGQASMVEIDFTGLGKTIDTVKLPAAAIKDIAAKAQNEEVGGLTVKLPEAEISFDANALSAIQAQAGSQITLTVTPAKPTDLNNRQKEAVGSAPVFDLTLRSSSGAITDFRGGYATVSLPYTLAAGQNPSGVVVYYLDSTGNITPCTTMYDVRSKSAIFTTGHLSLYFVGYDPAAVWVNPFSDVAEGAWYYDAVRYASENGLMGGYGNGKFGPNDNLSRAQFAQILFNKEGRPVVNYLLRYNDVADGAWYTEAVRWATSQGVVSGYGNGMFGPNDNITREQLAVMLWRYAGSPAATEKELHFTDADKASGYALEALRWAVENGVMGGYGNGQLAPQGLATRAQVAQMLMNFLKNR